MWYKVLLKEDWFCRHSGQHTLSFESIKLIEAESELEAEEKTTEFFNEHKNSESTIRTITEITIQGSYPEIVTGMCVHQEMAFAMETPQSLSELVKRDEKDYKTLGAILKENHVV